MLKNTTSVPVALAVMALFATSCRPPEPSTAGEQGFTVAYFSEKTLKQYMSVDKCAALRFYNARRFRDDTDGTVMIMATNSGGEDLYDRDGLMYTYYDKLGESSATTGEFREDEAEESTDYMHEAGDATYAANFSVSEVHELMQVKGCMAFQVTPERNSARQWTMRLTPVSIADGVVTVLGDETTTLLCGEPCPTYCGTEPSYYVHCRD